MPDRLCLRTRNDVTLDLTHEVAWRKAADIAECLDAAVVALAALASQALHVARRTRQAFQ